MNSPVEAHSHDVISNFQPSLAVIVAVLAFILFIAFFFLFISKCVRRNSDAENAAILFSLAPTHSGIDRTVVESLPFFRFSALKGSRQGLECSVCLSLFEDLEILRLLPKCNHAFHINCVDKWLENHSSCPLCRCKVNLCDKRLFSNQSEIRQESNMELLVQREETARLGIGETEPKTPHRHNHRIIASGLVFNNRWSSLCSPDLLLLNVEMLNSMASSRFSSCSIGESELKEEMEVRRLLAPEVIETGSSSSIIPSYPLIFANRGDRRAISDIVSRPRTENLENGRGDREQERVRRHWLHIARRTARWFANGQNNQQGINDVR